MMPPTPINNPVAEECAVYIASCDAYQDLWRGFFASWDKHWPDCPFKVYLGAGSQTFPSGNVISLSTRATSTLWSDCVIAHLSQLPHMFVLLTLDDFFLRAPVDTDRLRDILALMIRTRAHCVRLLNKPGPDRPARNYPFVGDCGPNSPYRVCVQASFWRREDLLALLHPGESIWEFEKNAPIRAAHITGGFLAVDIPALPYRGLLFHHVIEKGQWIPTEYLRCRLLRLPIDAERRRQMRISSFALLLVAEVTNRVFEKIFRSRSAIVRERIKFFMPRGLVASYQRRRLRK